MECPKGYFHTNQVSDIFVRDENLELSNINDEGILQCISIVPSSYPGNSVLLEDKAFIKEKIVTVENQEKFFLLLVDLTKSKLEDVVIFLKSKDIKLIIGSKIIKRKIRLLLKKTTLNFFQNYQKIF